MRCPYCGHEEDKVVDSRTVKEGKAVRRRRECTSCAKRFTTYEYIQDFDLNIIKSDARREPYDRQKLVKGLILACHKRPVSLKKIEAEVDDIEKRLIVTRKYFIIKANESGWKRGSPLFLINTNCGTIRNDQLRLYIGSRIQWDLIHPKTIH